MTGRSPSRNPFLPYSRQSIRAEEIRTVAGVLREDLITQGPRVTAFEKRFAAAVGAKHAVAVSSGTAALHAACHAAGLGPGAEAVVPPLSFVATANAVLYVGARPVFADVDAATGTLDPASLRRSLSSRTRAVLPVDYAGHPCDYDAIRKIARKRNLIVIQDAAHALGATYRGRRIGSLSDLTIFSFHPVKHLTTGEGGMVVTNSSQLARRVRRFAAHGITKDPAEMDRNEGPWYYEMRELGYNFRITDFQCALGAAQLKRLGTFVRARRALARKYADLLSDVPEVTLPVERPWARHAYHLYPVRVSAGSRRRVFESLRRRGIGVQVHYIPIHLQPFYRRNLKTRRGLCPAAEAFSASEISLPLFPGMKDRDVRRVVAALKDALAS